MSGHADNVIQARDIRGGIHLHQPVPVPLTPQQLPWAQPVFVNREAGLHALDLAIAEEPMLATVVGMPGVGKTSLALRWSHQNRERFPDGQLYVGLNGYAPEPPLAPDHALGRFLVALGVPRAELTSDVEDAAALYRSLISSRRMLIVLDNAADPSQVRPLLPGPGGCAVIVTSRHHMSGLVARDGARRIALDVLPEGDAITLLESVTTAERAGDPAATRRDLAVLCARLPLALRIAAEHALRRPQMSLRDLTEELRGTASWQALTTEGSTEGQPAAHSVFTWSYRALPRDIARSFRMLALHPGAEFSSAAAAALTADEMIIRSIGFLVGAHLLEQPSPDRYQFHDLVRSYAMGQAQHDEPSGELRNAIRRAVTWYLRSADAAQAWINPAEARVEIHPLPDDRQPASFASYDEAVRWFDLERANLAAAVRQAAEHGMDELTWRLAVVLRAIYMRFNTFGDWIATSEAGLQAASGLGDQAATAELLESLGMAYTQAHNVELGTSYHRRALESRRQIGDRRGIGLSLNSLGLGLLRSHQFAAAESAFTESLEVFLGLADTQWPPVIRANLAEVIIGLGRSSEAESLISAALIAFRERGDHGGEGNALRLLSMVRRRQGDLEGARTAAEQAVSIAQAHHNPMWEGYWLLELGAAQQLSGDLDGSLASFGQAAALEHRLGDRTREAQAWDGAGQVNAQRGNLATAIGLHAKAAEVFGSHNAAWLETTALAHLAFAQKATRDIHANETARRAAETLSNFTDPDAETLRAALRELSVE
jgi:tetratricopeptide (TPR) repeat protein